MSIRWISQQSCKRDYIVVAGFGVGGKANNVVDKPGMNVCLVMGVLHLSDDWSADIAQVLFRTHVNAGENSLWIVKQLPPIIGENIIQVLDLSSQSLALQRIILLASTYTHAGKLANDICIFVYALVETLASIHFAFLCIDQIIISFRFNVLLT